MKKTIKIIVLTLIVITTIIPQGFAQGVAKDAQQKQLLTQYFQMKDALVSSNATLAASSAEAFLQIVNIIDSNIISEGNRKILAKDAKIISESKDLKKQRLHFAPLSDKIVTLAKKIKLSGAPIYEMYCPMKKANWLSDVKAVKNPYYGKSMLTCGKVVETID